MSTKHPDWLAIAKDRIREIRSQRKAAADAKKVLMAADLVSSIRETGRQGGRKPLCTILPEKENA